MDNSEILDQIQRLLITPMSTRFVALEDRVASLEKTIRNGLSERITSIETKVDTLTTRAADEDAHERTWSDRRWQLFSSVVKALLVIAAAGVVGWTWTGLTETIADMVASRIIP